MSQTWSKYSRSKWWATLKAPGKPTSPNLRKKIATREPVTGLGGATCAIERSLRTCTN